jgi:hypothetical protein
LNLDRVVLYLHVEHRRDFEMVGETTCRSMVRP